MGRTLSEGAWGLAFPVKLAEEEVMLCPLEMEQHACDVREQGKVSGSKKPSGECSEHLQGPQGFAGEVLCFN